jgi:steroid 5-alpha reductase family enzyme
MFSYLVIVALSVLAYTTFWYFYGLWKGRLDVADEAWGLAQPFIVAVSMIAARNYSLTAFILLMLTTVWGYRLFSHLHKRHATSTSEDRRYTEMRSGWKQFPKLQAYIYVFLLQGVLMYLLGIGSLILVANGNSWNPLSVIGVLLWTVGFVLEAISDNQLKKFITNPDNKGKIMNQGLWKYSRHPNYFGEVTMWWGLFIYVFINTGSLWVIISPLTITYLIVFVSGIPMTEKSFEANPLWQKYKRKTSSLIPWFNKR